MRDDLHVSISSASTTGAIDGARPATADPAAATFKALSALLAYPTDELIDALPDVAAVVEREPALPDPQKRALGVLIAMLADANLLDAQERYVALFDRGRATSLHLFEHVHGESRDRGQAMVDLRRVYEDAGFAATARELPDYLPLLLEFASLVPYEVAGDMLQDSAHLLRRIGAALAQRGSGYASVFDALLALIGAEGFARQEVACAQPDLGEPSLDEEWADEEVVFGPSAACAQAQPPATAIVQFLPDARRAARSLP